MNDVLFAGRLMVWNKVIDRSPFILKTRAITPPSAILTFRYCTASVPRTWPAASNSSAVSTEVWVSRRKSTCKILGICSRLRILKTGLASKRYALASMAYPCFWHVYSQPELPDSVCGNLTPAVWGVKLGISGWPKQLGCLSRQPAPRGLRIPRATCPRRRRRSQPGR